MRTYDQSLEYLIHLAEDAVYDGEYALARNLIDSGLSEEPGYARLHYTLAWMYHYYQVHHLLAERYYLLAIHFDNGYSQAYYGLVELYLKSKNLDGLRALMIKAEKSGTMDKYFIHETLGKAAELKEDFQEAVRSYKVAMLHCMDNDYAKELRQNVRRCRFKKFRRLTFKI